MLVNSSMISGIRFEVWRGFFSFVCTYNSVFFTNITLLSLTEQLCQVECPPECPQKIFFLVLVLSLLPFSLPPSCPPRLFKKDRKKKGFVYLLVPLLTPGFSHIL